MDLTGYDASDSDFGSAWDPQATYDLQPFELFRCCILRTLLAYNGHSVAGGGAYLRPDLATEMPAVAADGLTWTFHLRSGIHYAPPMADREIVAGDVVRALERALRRDPLWTDATQPAPSFTPYSSYFSDVIAGALDFVEGNATSISGLETPDDHTLVIHLLRPTGDLGARLALPAAAPLPAGAADGHDTGYGRYLVASGPYMFEGSDQLNPALPPDQQPAASGYVRGDHLYLVRNPSWDRATDQIRGAFIDRIEITNLGDNSDLFNNKALLAAIKSDQIDLSLDTDLTADDLTQLRADPVTAARVHTVPTLESHYISLNLAVPPFDDVHVRRAVELATNKRAIVDDLFPGLSFQIANHAAPDTLENGLLSDYSPYATPGDAGDIAAAKVEMAQSGYDSTHDGVCDDRVCEHVSIPVGDDPNSSRAAHEFATDLALIGIQIETQVVSDPFAEAAPDKHAPLLFATGWVTDYISSTNWFEPLASSAGIGGNSNLSLIGATPEVLTGLGYPITSISSLDSGIAGCTALIGSDAFGCWSSLDQYVMQRSVAWVPLATKQSSRLTSSSVTAFDFDASAGLPALDQIQVAR